MKDLLLKYKRVVKYLIAGGTATLADLALLYLFTDILGVWYLISAGLAFAIAFFVSFFLQKFWTFRDSGKEMIYKQMGMYLAVALANFIINIGLMYLLVDGFKIWHMLAQFMASGIIAIESYLVYKTFIFNGKNKLENNKIKILIATGIFPPDIGGPATMLRAMAEALADKGMEVKVITYIEKENSKFQISNSKFQISAISRNQNAIFKYLQYFWRMLRLSLWADVIYVTDTYSVGYFAYVIKKFTGKPYVVRFAGDSAWESAAAAGLTGDYITDFQKKTYSAAVEKLKARQARILGGADKVIAVSYFLAELARMIGVKPEKIKVIYNSVDFLAEPSAAVAATEIRRRYGKNAKIVVTACRLTPWKGVAGIIKILPRLIEKIGPVNFLVLGDGQELANLRKLADGLNVTANAHFLGRVHHEEILNYLAAADAFVLNTNYEGLSHTLLEAMKAGAPIVTTDAGGNPEVIADGHEGLLVKYNDQAGLLNACVKILTDDKLAAFLAANAAVKLNKFSWRAAVEQTALLLNEIKKSA